MSRKVFIFEMSSGICSTFLWDINQMDISMLSFCQQRPEQSMMVVMPRIVIISLIRERWIIRQKYFFLVKSLSLSFSVLIVIIFVNRNERRKLSLGVEPWRPDCLRPFQLTPIWGDPQKVCWKLWIYIAASMEWHNVSGEFGLVWIYLRLYCI